MGEPSDLVLLKSLLADVEEDIGLLFNPALGPSGCEQTREGCWTFAWTGGDGVHFSLLDTGIGVGNNSPVVMTVPMAVEPNRVVGRNLRHFLGLGLHSGFFVLEQLQYDFDETVARLEGREWEQYLSDETRRALADAAASLQATAWVGYRSELLILAASH